MCVCVCVREREREREERRDGLVGWLVGDSYLLTIDDISGGQEAMRCDRIKRMMIIIIIIKKKKNYLGLETWGGGYRCC